VPAASDLSRTTILDQLRIGYGATGKLSPYPPGMLAAVGLFSRDIREVSRSSYQFRMPFVNTADDTERELGVTATPWPDALSTTVASYR